MGPMSDLVQTSTSGMNTLSSMNFESSLMVPVTTAQQERQVMCELQEILDHSSQQAMMSMADTKPSTIHGPTSFFGMNLVGSLPMEVQTTFQEQSPIIITQTSPVPAHQQPTTSPVNLFNEITQHSLQGMPRRQSNPSICPYEQTVTGTGVMPEMMGIQPVDPQILTISADEMMGCMSQNMKTESNSPESSSSSQSTSQSSSSSQQQQQQGQTTSQIINVINIMGGDLQGDQSFNQGSIANALTQMSDNELLRYINPSCFEQGSCF